MAEGGYVVVCKQTRSRAETIIRRNRYTSSSDTHTNVACCDARLQPQQRSRLRPTLTAFKQRESAIWWQIKGISVRHRAAISIDRQNREEGLGRTWRYVTTWFDRIYIFWFLIGFDATRKEKRRLHTLFFSTCHTAAKLRSKKHAIVRWKWWTITLK